MYVNHIICIIRSRTAMSLSHGRIFPHREFAKWFSGNFDDLREFVALKNVSVEELKAKARLLRLRIWSTSRAPGKCDRIVFGLCQHPITILSKHLEGVRDQSETRRSLMRLFKWNVHQSICMQRLMQPGDSDSHHAPLLLMAPMLSISSIRVVHPCHPCRPCVQLPTVSCRPCVYHVSHVVRPMCLMSSMS